VDGACCNAACTGVCKACVGYKTGELDGTCTFITFGTDPDDECVAPQVCGTGVCCEVLPFRPGDGRLPDGGHLLCEPP
jgi:hypothetical protein